MAHVAKYTRSAMGHMLAHYDRSANNISNPNIKPELTDKNYNLAPERDISFLDFIKQRCDEVLKEELKSKNIQIEKLQSELERERKYSREQSNKIAVLADQAQRLHLAEMSQIEKPLEEIEKEEVEVIKENPSFWKRVFGKKE